MRLVDGKENPVISREEALKMAKEAHLDLIEVSGTTEVPAVKITDLRKYIYDQDRKKGTVRMSRSAGKEIRLSPGIGLNDLQLKVKKIRAFLADGHAVKVTVQFRGREIVHLNVGEDKLKIVLGLIEDVGKIEGPSKRMGGFLSVIVVPK